LAYFLIDLKISRFFNVYDFIVTSTLLTQVVLTGMWRTWFKTTFTRAKGGRTQFICCAYGYQSMRGSLLR